MRRTMAHNPPIQVACLATAQPDWSTSAYGPFIVHPAARLDELPVLLGQFTCDAVVLRLDGPQALKSLLAWPGLARLMLDAALLVVAPEPALVDALRLLRLGAQDVLPAREVAGPAGDETLARATRLAVERQRLARAARQAYATDLGTGLPNQGQLMEHMTHLLALREREPAAMALLAVRIEGLAAAEARMGTEAANVLRRKVAVRLRAGLRASDVVASLGVDSFAVLLAWIENPEDGQRVADKLVRELKRPFSVSGQDLGLALAVGVAQYPAHAKDAMGLVHRAMQQAGAGVLVGRTGVAMGVGKRAMDSAANDE